MQLNTDNKGVTPYIVNCLSASSTLITSITPLSRHGGHLLPEKRAKKILGQPVNLQPVPVKNVPFIVAQKQKDVKYSFSSARTDHTLPTGVPAHWRAPWKKHCIRITFYTYSLANTTSRYPARPWAVPTHQGKVNPSEAGDRGM